MKGPRHVSHDEVVADMPKADPAMADVYLATALDEATLPGGQFALLAALRHIDKFKAYGDDWHTRINDALKCWVQSHA